MTKPVIIFDPDWRRVDELFSSEAFAALRQEFDVVWGQDGNIPQAEYASVLPHADILIAATPKISKQDLEVASRLHTIVEVSGAFPDTIDYEACFARGVEVLSCAPGFRQSVAEMGLAMALAGARGLVREHEAFRKGEENWLDDRADTDFSLYGACIGFVGFGQIAQELSTLLAPFRSKIVAYDPWLSATVAEDHGVELCSLEEVLAKARCVFVTAAPTSENYHLLNADRLACLQDRALLIVLSRAHLVDFVALDAELARGRLQACIDVFPTEPMPADAAIRQRPGAFLSPHRAAAVKGGRQLIGDMILSDLRAISNGLPERRLARADMKTIGALAGIGDAAAVQKMAQERPNSD